MTKVLMICCACVCPAPPREVVIITLESVSVYDLWLSDQQEEPDPYDWDYPPAEEPEPILIDFYSIDDEPTGR